MLTNVSDKMIKVRYAHDEMIKRGKLCDKSSLMGAIKAWLRSRGNDKMIKRGKLCDEMMKG